MFHAVIMGNKVEANVPQTSLVTFAFSGCVTFTFNNFIDATNYLIRIVWFALFAAIIQAPSPSSFVHQCVS